MYKSVVQSTVAYGAKTKDVTRQNRSKLAETDMDYLRQSSSRSKLERIRNDVIRQSKNMTTNIVKDVKKKQLVRFGLTK